MTLFLIRLLLFFPLCTAIWWLLGVFEVESISRLLKSFLGLVFPSVQLVIETHAKGISFYPKSLSGAEATFTMDPMAVTRGLPLYMALMLAVPGLKLQSKKALGGVFLIALLAMMGFFLEAFLRVGESFSVSSAAPFGVGPKTFFPGMLSPEFVQILNKAMVTRVLPVTLFLWQERQFIRRSIEHGAEAGP